MSLGLSHHLKVKGNFRAPLLHLRLTFRCWGHWDHHGVQTRTVPNTLIAQYIITLHKRRTNTEGLVPFFAGAAASDYSSVTITSLQALIDHSFNFEASAVNRERLNVTEIPDYVKGLVPNVYVSLGGLCLMESYKWYSHFPFLGGDFRRCYSHLFEVSVAGSLLFHHLGLLR